MTKKPDSFIPDDRLVRDIADFDDYRDSSQNRLKIDEVLDTPIVIEAVTFTRGRQGVFMIAKSYFMETGEKFMLITGAAEPMDVCHIRKDKEQLPFACRIVKIGRGYYVKSARVEQQ